MYYQLAHAIRLVLRRAHIGVINMETVYQFEEIKQIRAKLRVSRRTAARIDNRYAELQQAVTEGDTDKARHLLESTDWRTSQERGQNTFPEDETYDTSGFMISRLKKQVEIGRAVGFYAASPS
jgi:hypothetical protein